MGRHGSDNSGEIPRFPQLRPTLRPWRAPCLARTQRPLVAVPHRHGASDAVQPRATIRTCLLAVGLAGCTGFGPDTMRHQQADYAAALADAGKRQTLLNIVKLRYGDVPAFVTVNQILAGYSLQGTFSVGTDLLSGGSLRLSDDAQVGVGGTFTNSPTVTYAPVTGADFARTFLAPMQPADLFGLMLAGVPPELVLGPRAAFDRRLRQRARYARARQAAADPSFAEVLALLLELQRAGRLGVQLGVRSQERVASLQDRARRRQRTRPRASLRRLLELARRPRHLRGGLHVVDAPRVRSRSVPAR